MTSPIEILLKENLTHSTTNYQLRQLIKADNLTEAIIQVVHARRKHVTRQRIWFVVVWAAIALFAMLPFLVRMSSSQDSGFSDTFPAHILVPMLISAMMSFWTVFDNVYSLSRLETLATLWLMEQSGTTEVSEELIHVLFPTVSAGGKPWRKMQQIESQVSR